MPDSTAARRPDAVRVPRSYPATKLTEDRHLKLRTEFAPVLGCKQVHSRSLSAMNESLVTASADVNAVSLLFPYGHPNQLEDRYEWFIGQKQADGSYRPVAPVEGTAAEAGRVKLGYLKPDPHADSPAARAAMAEALEQRIAEHQNDPAFLEHLAELGISHGAAPQVNPNPSPTTNPNPNPEGPNAAG